MTLVFELIAGVILLVFFLVRKSWFPYIMQTDKYGAPYVAMEAEVVERVMNLVEISNKDVFYELGSGDGRLVIAAAHRGARAVGIEIDHLRVLWSRFWIRFWGLGHLARVEEKNFFEVDLSSATIVHTYLLQETNQRLQEKLLAELAPGSKVVAVGFKFPDWEPVKTDPRGTIYGPIYLYIIPPIV